MKRSTDTRKKKETQPARLNFSGWLPPSQQVTRMLEQYGDAAAFLQAITPQHQLYASREWVRAYTGMAPTLATVVAGYGQETAVVWICIELEDINLFACVKEKLPVKRQKDLANLIIAEYGYLRVSELLLFFHRLKCGHYGRFYGSVDALFITQSLLQFISERQTDLARIEEMREKQKQTASTTYSNCISYAEYLAWKEQNEAKINEQPSKNENNE